MSNTLLDRLREVRCDREPFTPDHARCVCRLSNEAADEIERLRGLLVDTEYIQMRADHSRGQLSWANMINAREARR